MGWGRLEPRLCRVQTPPDHRRQTGDDRPPHEGEVKTETAAPLLHSNICFSQRSASPILYGAGNAGVPFSVSPKREWSAGRRQGVCEAPLGRPLRSGAPARRHDGVARPIARCANLRRQGCEACRPVRRLPALHRRSGAWAPRRQQRQQYVAAAPVSARRRLMSAARAEERDADVNNVL